MFTEVVRWILQCAYQPNVQNVYEQAIGFSRPYDIFLVCYVVLQLADLAGGVTQHDVGADRTQFFTLWAKIIDRGRADPKLYVMGREWAMKCSACLRDMHLEDSREWEEPDKKAFDLFDNMLKTE